MAKDVVGFAGDNHCYHLIDHLLSFLDRKATKLSRAWCIGLGNMGTSMATNLLQFLSHVSPEDPFEPRLYVYNRTQSKADKLVSQGATLAPTISGQTPGHANCDWSPLHFFQGVQHLGRY